MSSARFRMHQQRDAARRKRKGRERDKRNGNGQGAIPAGGNVVYEEPAAGEAPAAARPEDEGEILTLRAKLEDMESDLARAQAALTQMEAMYGAERDTSDKWGLPKGYAIVERATPVSEGPGNIHKFRAEHEASAWKSGWFIERKEAYPAAWEHEVELARKKNKGKGKGKNKGAGKGEENA